MVPVGDVERGHAGKGRDQGARLLAAGAPERVLHAVGGGEVVDRLGPGYPTRDVVDRRGCFVREEHDAGLRAQLDDVARAVVLLVAARTFVLLDDVRLVLVDGEAAGDSRLLVSCHPQTVEIQRRLAVGLERRASAQRIEVLARSCVHLRRVRVGSGREIDFGASNVKETERVVGRQLPRFLGAHYVIGDRRNRRRAAPRRTQCAERMNRGHPHILLDYRIY